MQDLTIEAGNLTTKPSGPVGTLAVHGALNDSPVEFSARTSTSRPTSFAREVLDPELQPAPDPALSAAQLPASLDSGIAGVDHGGQARAGEGPSGLAVGPHHRRPDADRWPGQPGKTTPFLTVPRIAVGLKEVNLVSRDVTISSVDIEGARPQGGARQAGADRPAPADQEAGGRRRDRARRLRRASQGACGRPCRSRAVDPRRAKAEPEFKITVEKVTLKGGATFTDEAVSTPADGAEGEQPGGAARRRDVAEHPAHQPRVRPSTLPGGGKVNAKGAVKIEPLDLTLTLNTRNAPIEPYRAYFPFPASFAGRFNSDSQNRVRITNGKLTALSRGNSWATDLAVKSPDGKETPLRLERMEINGIDFGWPTHARVARVLLRKPVAELDRAADGSINVQKLFTPAPEEVAAAARRQAGASVAAGARDDSGSPGPSSRGPSRRWISTSRRSWSRTGTCASSTARPSRRSPQDITKLSRHGQGPVQQGEPAGQPARAGDHRRRRRARHPRRHVGDRGARPT